MMSLISLPPTRCWRTVRQVGLSRRSVLTAACARARHDGTDPGLIVCDAAMEVK